METLILWLGFIGAWLLFAGPIYQAALELQDEDIEIDRIRAAGAHVEPMTDTSIWWWLLPPVKVYLEQKRRKAYQIRYIKALTPEDVEAVISLSNKATAWLFVAVGGLCIAVKETYELAQHAEWNDVVLVALIVVMFLASIMHLITRLRRTKRIVNKAKS